ncbi:MAG: flavodoxin-dependent (E)-4-hydroxy-3-methylbut-2-enyl-diphosphate synthase [Candidatus Dadabacteria bacterium]|nr:MAG: flavodoxin-dependent (E)-4-hydroxy-3-methylbut-2-enyl-diphosphate synthase [Candidatus Dadabacteria bacterium]
MADLLHNNASNTTLRRTRKVVAGPVTIGGEEPIVVQSMCATKTTDILATLEQIRMLKEAGAALIRVAVDSRRDVDALREIRKETKAPLVVDLQENYRLVSDVAPLVEKVRYNPGHLHHHEKEKSVKDKVKFIVDTAGSYNCAIRIGVNFGSLDPEKKGRCNNEMEAAVACAIEHCDMLDSMGFYNYVVSLKSSDPFAVIKINQAFAEKRPEVPIHLGVTEAGLPPGGIIKTRIAFEKLLGLGIGETIRVSLTLPIDKKFEEVKAAYEIIEDVKKGTFLSSRYTGINGLNIISCPSCSRVENASFVELAEKIRDAVSFADDHNISIAVMGCRVNGPGETDVADLGLWCGPKKVNLKRGSKLIGAFGYDEVVDALLRELKDILASRT